MSIRRFICVLGEELRILWCSMADSLCILPARVINKSQSTAQTQVPSQFKVSHPPNFVLIPQRLWHVHTHPFPRGNEKGAPSPVRLTFRLTYSGNSSLLLSVKIFLNLIWLNARDIFYTFTKKKRLYSSYRTVPSGSFFLQLYWDLIDMYHYVSSGCTVWGFDALMFCRKMMSNEA